MLDAVELELYAAYYNMPEFELGFWDYNQGVNQSDRLSGVAAQAYDRGAECAMRRARASEKYRG